MGKFETETRDFLTEYPKNGLDMLMIICNIQLVDKDFNVEDFLDN